MNDGEGVEAIDGLWSASSRGGFKTFCRVLILERR
jgi:hypothetical protein